MGYKNCMSSELGMKQDQVFNTKSKTCTCWVDTVYDTT